MMLTGKRKLFLLLTFHALWGVILWLSISKYGLGISTDSVHYLFAGLNLARGNGLFSFDGSFALFWPPLYPVLLALIHLATGLSIFGAANLLQFIAYAGMSYCLSILFLKIFPANFTFAFLGNILSDIGLVVLTTFGTVGSDYVHLALVMAFILLTSLYMEHQSPRALLAMSLVGMLAMLDRYLGIAVIGMGVVLVFLYTSAGVLLRLWRSFLLGLSALPALLWFFVASPLIGKRAPISFADNFTWFSRSILDWIVREPIPKTGLPFSIAILWLVVSLLMIVLVLLGRRYPAPGHDFIPPLLYGLFYTLALFGSAAITYFNKLAGRFLLPVYIPFLVLALLSMDVLLRFARDRSPSFHRIAQILIFSALALFAFGLVQNTLPVVVQSYSNGAPGDNYFNTRAWNGNSVLQYWKENPPGGDYLLFSNYPDAIAFHTMHNVYSSPRQYSGPYGKEVLPLDQYKPQLFSSGQAVYLIWIEPNDYAFLYPVEQLNTIANVYAVFESEDGGIYRLFPLPASQKSP